MKILCKAYKLLVIFACHLYRQERTKIFPQKLVDFVGSSGNWRKTLQPAHHVGSQVQGIGYRTPKSTQGSASEDIHVCLHLGWSMCPLAVPSLGFSMDTFRNLCALLLRVLIWMQLLWSYHTITITLRHLGVHDNIWAGSTLHVIGINGVIDRHRGLVCLTPCNLHMDV